MNLKNKSILLTGGAGFIGTKLCSKLYKNNEILIYDNLRRNSIKFTSLLNENNVRLVEGDVLDLRHLKEVIGEFRPNIVIHLAAIAGIDTVIKSPVNTMKVNIIGTYNVLEAIKPLIDKIERFIFFSTSEVFGSYAYKVEEIHTTNLAPVGEARWTYSVGKLAAEHLVNSYHKEFDLRAVTVRPFNIYGPGQVGEGAIHAFITRALKGQKVQIHGEGDQIRSWCYIDDMTHGIMLCLEKKEAIGEVFNIGNPRGTITILNLAQKIAVLCKSKSKTIFVPKTYVDVELRIPNIEKAKKILEYSPKMDLDEGLKRTIEWYQDKMPLTNKMM